MRALLLACAITVAGCASPTPFVLGEETRGPVAFYMLWDVPARKWFTLREVDTKLTEQDIKRIIDRVQAKAQAGHIFITDQEVWGLNDKWVASLIGDCDDYVLWVERELLKRGIPGNYVTAWTELGEYHMVFSVNGWILDNRRKKVVKRGATGYRFHNIQRNGQWYKVRA